MQNRVTGSYNYNVICKVCGWKLKAADARKRWDGLEPVCPVTCWEPRHPADFYKQRNDFHKLPFISTETAVVDGMFPAENLPDSDDVVTVPSGADDNTWAHRFTCHSTGYIEAVRFYLGVPESQSGFDRSMANTYYKVFLWGGAVEGTLLWSKSALMIPGRWNTIQVIPNVSCTSGLTYEVGITGGSHIPVVTLPTQSKAATLGTYSHATDDTRPTTAQATVTLLADIKIRTST